MFVSSVSATDKVATMHYLGSLKETRDPPNPKYEDYARSNPMPRQSFRPGRREEFAACLNRVGVGIDSDDVQGIRKVILNWLILALCSCLPAHPGCV